MKKYFINDYIYFKFKNYFDINFIIYFICSIIFMNKYYQILLKIFNSKLLLLNILYYFLKFIL